MMARSYRKSPYIGVTMAESEKKDKQIANRRLRHLVKQTLRRNPYALLPLLREISNVWMMDKDGRQRIDVDSKWMRK